VASSQTPPHIIVDINGWLATGEAFSSVGPKRVLTLVRGTAVGAVSLNGAVTNPKAAGFLTVYSYGARAPVWSGNFVGGQAVANAVVATPSTLGTFCFHSGAVTDLVVGVNGWPLTGSRLSAIDSACVLDSHWLGWSDRDVRTYAVIAHRCDWLGAQVVFPHRLVLSRAV